ncbi:MAG TPA: ribosome-binding factor A [Patescibacteria group bacterium]|nr:ribosome-binding factor A [Patescibacteria group bacterium]
MSLRVEAGFEHLKDALAETFAKDIEFLPGVLVTVLAAKVTANTAQARITLSVFPESAESEIKGILADMDHEIKNGLAKRLRLRRIPDLHYVFDDMPAHVSDIDETVRILKEKGEIQEP